MYMQVIRTLRQVGITEAQFKPLQGWDGAAGTACRTVQPASTLCVSAGWHSVAVLFVLFSACSKLCHTTLYELRAFLQDPPLAAAAELAQMLEQQLQPPHANQAVAAALVASGLHRVLAAGGQAAQAEGPAAAELVSFGAVGWLVPRLDMRSYWCVLGDQQGPHPVLRCCK